MLSNLLFSYFSYEIKYHVSCIKQNSPVLATTCKRSHVDKMNGAPVGPFRVCIDRKNTLYWRFHSRFCVVPPKTEKMQKAIKLNMFLFTKCSTLLKSAFFYTYHSATVEYRLLCITRYLPHHSSLYFILIYTASYFLLIGNDQRVPLDRAASDWKEGGVLLAYFSSS